MNQRKQKYVENKGDSRRPHGLKLIHAISSNGPTGESWHLMQQHYRRMAKRWQAKRFGNTWGQSSMDRAREARNFGRALVQFSPYRLHALWRPVNPLQRCDRI